jgi:hypothetical protein
MRTISLSLGSRGGGRPTSHSVRLGGGTLNQTGALHFSTSESEFVALFLATTLLGSSVWEFRTFFGTVLLPRFLSLSTAIRK